MRDQLIGVTRRGRWTRCAAVIIALTAILIAVRFTDDGHVGDDGAASDVLDHMPARVLELLTYTPSTVLTELDDETDWLTADFGREHEARMRHDVAPAVAAASTASSATLQAAAVRSSSSDRVELLLFVNVSVTDATSPGASVHGSRLEVAVVRVGEEWLIDAIDAV